MRTNIQIYLSKGLLWNLKCQVRISRKEREKKSIRDNLSIKTKHVPPIEKKMSWGIKWHDERKFLTSIWRQTHRWSDIASLTPLTCFFLIFFNYCERIIYPHESHIRLSLETQARTLGFFFEFLNRIDDTIIVCPICFFLNWWTTCRLLG